MRLVPVIMFALFLAANPASAWQEYVYLEQGVAIQFPAQPQASKSTFDSAFAKGLPSMVYSAEHDQVLYKLTVVDLASRPDMGANFLNEAAYWLMRTGEVEANIVVLNDLFRLSQVAELVDRKRHGAEKMALDEKELAQHDRYLDQLESELVEAHAGSHLPEAPTTVEALDELVVRLRHASR